MTDESTAPRRSTRQPKPPRRELFPVAEHVPAKRKAKEVDPAEQLRHFLQNPKSRLTKMDLTDLINANTWSMLSPESQTRLAALLPATAFPSLWPAIEVAHPAAGDSMSVDPGRQEPELVDASLFTDAHFLAGARTFQDHLYSNWLSDAQAEKDKRYEQGIRDGTLAAPWKDEVWERDNKPEVEEPNMHATLAGEAAELKLVDLAKSAVIREGDVLAYKRNFPALGIVVEKDLIIQQISPRTHNVTVLLEPGLTRDLPLELLQPGPSEPSAPTRSMTITSPSQLENGLLDVDGRVERAKRSNGNAWKAITLWRWTGDSLSDVCERRGGREDHGTLFYLRACHYQDR
ncbi:Asx homology domain-containing protein [Mycena pura]|uniref:Asx homology domain-containing protein n=1 Tax=Mycena pura TaxID=153505 RepID=A0AAD6V726_9AGAR|nr:Asx homology domain-containing protein [Mycena pura]